MLKIPKSYERRKELLRILKDHGPLSIKGISYIVEPPMDARRLHDSLNRLGKRKLVSKRHQNLFRGAGVFYQITQDDSTRANVAKLINCAPESLVQTQFRYRELLHSEQCAVWAHRLKLLFPEAKIIREYEFKQCSIAQKSISTVTEDHELRPDVLMIFNEFDPKKYLVIGIEVERVMKSKERLEKKLFNLVSRTFLDGIIYVCESDSMLETLKTVYQSKVIHKAIRVRNYGENFLLFTSSNETNKCEMPVMFNSKLATVNLKSWVQNLSNTDARMRNDNMFVSQHSHPESLNSEETKEEEKRFFNLSS